MGPTASWFLGRVPRLQNQLIVSPLVVLRGSHPLVYLVVVCLLIRYLLIRQSEVGPSLHAKQAFPSPPSPSLPLRRRPGGFVLFSAIRKNTLHLLRLLHLLHVLAGLRRWIPSLGLSLLT